MFKYYNMGYKKEYTENILFGVKNGVMDWSKITVKTAFQCKFNTIIVLRVGDGLIKQKRIIVGYSNKLDINALNLNK